MLLAFVTVNGPTNATPSRGVTCGEGASVIAILRAIQAPQAKVYGAWDVPFVRKSYIVAHLDASVRREIDAVQFPFETDLTIVSISNELRKKVASDLEDIISFA